MSQWPWFSKHWQTRLHTVSPWLRVQIQTRFLRFIAREASQRGDACVTWTSPTWAFHVHALACLCVKAPLREKKENYNVEIKFLRTRQLRAALRPSAQPWLRFELRTKPSSHSYGTHYQRNERNQSFATMMNIFVHRSNRIIKSTHASAK